jgi:hypothetical protein
MPAPGAPRTGAAPDSSHAAATLRFVYVPEPEQENCLGKRVLCADSQVVGRVCAVVHVHEDGECAYYIVNLGSVARVGEDRRAIPASVIVADADTGELMLRYDPEAVRHSPIYVEGPRCDTMQWLHRVAAYYAQL